jgi:steroid delta-isomerase-like uncharacterized protein
VAAPATSDLTKETSMAVSEGTMKAHEAFARRFYELWNAGETDTMYGMLDPKVHDFNAAEGEAGREGVMQVLNHIRSALPDLRYTVDDVISDGVDKFAVFLTARGTQTGELFGSPPKNRTAEWREVRVCRLRDGKVIEHRAIVDSLSMMRQLGHIAPPGRESW